MDNLKNRFEKELIERLLDGSELFTDRTQGVYSSYLTQILHVALGLKEQQQKRTQRLSWLTAIVAVSKVQPKADQPRAEKFF